MNAGSVEVTTNPASARFQWLAAPLALPGSCGCCGKSKFDKGFVSIGLNFEFYGALIFCAECALNISAVVGGLTPDEYEVLSEQAFSLAAELKVAVNRIKELEVIEDAIKSYNSINVSVDDSSGNVCELVQPEELDESGESDDESDSLPTEPIIEQRPDDSSDVTSSNPDDPTAILASIGIT